MIFIMVVMAIGFAQILAPATESILGSLPREKAGVGSAMNDTTRQIGGAIGVAVLGSIVASTYRSQMATKLDGKVRAGVVHAASDSVGAAIGAARDVAAPVGRQVIAAAQSSFVSGMHVAVVVARRDRRVGRDRCAPVVARACGRRRSRARARLRLGPDRGARAGC